MKQVKIAYDKCRAKLPNRPPDEIDFGLGWRAAASYFLQELEIEESYETFHARIKEELE